MENTFGHIREKGGRHEDLFDSTPLQFFDEIIRFSSGSREQL